MSFVKHIIACLVTGSIALSSATLAASPVQQLNIPTFTTQESEFMKYSKRKKYDQIMPIYEDLFEASKIVGMSVAAAVIFGITHDLITSHINFDYFASDRTHHGPVTREHFPSVYESKSPILYSLLWGTIATWWVGLASGTIVAASARIGSAGIKLRWDELIVPTSIVLGGTLATSLIAGGLTYLATSDSFTTVAVMHSTSYISGGLLSLGLAGYTIKMRFNAPSTAVQPRSLPSNSGYKSASAFNGSSHPTSFVVPLVNINW